MPDPRRLTLLNCRKIVRRKSTPLPPSDYTQNYTVEYLFSLPPLYLAVFTRNEAAVRLLLRHGATPLIRDSFGCSPLHLSASERFHSSECSLALVDFGAKVFAKNAQGVAPCQLSSNLAKRQRRLLKTKLNTLISCVHQMEMFKSGEYKTSSDNSKFKHMFLRRSADPNKRVAAAGVGDSGGRQVRQKLSSSEKERDSSIDGDRSGSISSTKSRASLVVKMSASSLQSHCEEFQEFEMSNIAKVG